MRKRKGKAWSSEEARQFLESARSEGDPLYPVYVLILVLGLRKGEVLGLTRDDVDFDGGELAIGSQLQRVSRQLLHLETKTATSDATLLTEFHSGPLHIGTRAHRHERTLSADEPDAARLYFRSGEEKGLAHQRSMNARVRALGRAR